jgi:hypothetical protein
MSQCQQSCLSTLQVQQLSATQLKVTPATIPSGCAGCQSVVLSETVGNVYVGTSSTALIAGISSTPTVTNTILITPCFQNCGLPMACLTDLVYTVTQGTVLGVSAGSTDPTSAAIKKSQNQAAVVTGVCATIGVLIVIAVIGLLVWLIRRQHRQVKVVVLTTDGERDTDGLRRQSTAAEFELSTMAATPTSTTTLATARDSEYLTVQATPAFGDVSLASAVPPAYSVTPEPHPPITAQAPSAAFRVKVGGVWGVSGVRALYLFAPLQVALASSPGTVKMVVCQGSFEEMVKQIRSKLGLDANSKPRLIVDGAEVGFREAAVGFPKNNTTSQIDQLLELRPNDLILVEV